MTLFVEAGGWSAQQEDAIRQARVWLADKHTKQQVFRIFGYAGTGKTTIAKELAKFVKKVMYGTLTGKAALVLRSKGCDGAMTLHSMIYTVKVDENTGKISFKLDRDCDLASADLLIIDEVSMVDDKMGEDIVSFGKKILVLGDPAQIRPIRGEGYFIKGEPDVMLTEVHRQAKDSPIIQMSMDIREGRRLRPGKWGDSEIISREDIEREDLAQRVIQADQVLCGLNRSRTMYNRRIREIKGFSGSPVDWYPTMGDKLICLKNDRERGLFNGSMWQAGKIKADDGVLDIVAHSLDEKRAPAHVEVFDEFFNGTESKLDWRQRRQSREFTFGWVITGHKAQGSQWDNVLTFDESAAFRDEWKNWLYTAVTRASKRTTVIL